MTDKVGPSQNAEPPAPVNGIASNPDQDSPSVPSFAHILPCTNPPVKYLDRLDGCATGIHVTREDTQDLNVLYRKMVDTIMAKYQSLEQATPDPCAVCKCPIVLGPSSPVLYLENCAHYFHYGCFEKGWPRYVRKLDCPRCKVSSSRTLLWPQMFPTEAVKNEHFKLQKLSFGLDVSPQTALQVNKCYEDEDNMPAFDLFLNDHHLTVRKRQPQGTWHCEERPSDYSMREPCGGCLPQITVDVTETYLVQVIRKLKLADQASPFFLGDILPLEEYPAFKATNPHLTPLPDYTKRKKLLFQFNCPFVRLFDPKGEQCSQGRNCEFWHGWPKKTPKYIVEKVKIRDFPRFFCLKNSRDSYERCIERIRVHSQEVVRCSDGFHPSTEDLKDMDGFAHKMAKQIMAPVVVPEPLVCAFCHKIAEPNSVWIHLQNCVHCLHVDCVSLVRRNNSSLDRKLDLHCPTCQVPSVRTIAWPGQFPSDMAKETIFTRQLAEFHLNIQANTQLAIVEVANQVITLNYGGPTLATIDAATAQDGATIWYD